MQNQGVIKIIDFIAIKPLILIWFIITGAFLYFACLEIEKSKEEYNKHKNRNLNIFLRILDFIWRKKYLWLFVSVGFFGSSLLRQFFKANLNDLLLFNTLVAVFWYSRETMDLKQISNKQIYHLRVEHKTNLRPYLRLQKKAGENRLQLVNEGKGVAVNLRSIYKKDDSEVKLPGITAMAAAPNSFTEGLTPTRLGIDFDSDEDCLIEINYNDVEGRNYRAVFKRNADYNDKFEIMEQKEV